MLHRRIACASLPPPRLLQAPPSPTVPGAVRVLMCCAEPSSNSNPREASSGMWRRRRRSWRPFANEPPWQSRLWRPPSKRQDAQSLPGLECHLSKKRRRRRRVEARGLLEHQERLRCTDCVRQQLMRSSPTYSTYQRQRSWQLLFCSEYRWL